ncbi:Spermidine synthase tetramerization domain [Trinorchestia longiramus]|nr:Spermidine synthase tetramerization domain [Trinorchestia longiramus]
MAGHSIPIDLRVEPSVVADDESRGVLLEKLTRLVEPYAGGLSKVNLVSLPGKNYQALYAAESGNTFTVKLYANGLVSGMLEHYTEDVNKQLIAVDEALQLEARIVKTCGASTAKVLAGIKRAPPLNPYYTSSDDRLLEYDIDEVKFSEVTPFQKVEILHSKSFGNILVLDNLQNLAESDLAYTHGLMNKGVDSYKGKTALILGGGDGALMHELLKEDPKHVLMVDIDEAVMRCCKEFLRAACGSTLDSFKGDNYETIVGDAIAYMKEYIKEGRQFDYVFADLTDVPIGEPVGDVWDFLGMVIELGTQLLKPGTGRYMTHATGVQCTNALSMFEKRLSSASVGMQDISRTAHYVPSFMEKWSFFQATRKPSS